MRGVLTGRGMVGLGFGLGVGRWQAWSIGLEGGLEGCSILRRGLHRPDLHISHRLVELTVVGDLEVA